MHDERLRRLPARLGRALPRERPAGRLGGGRPREPRQTSAARRRPQGGPGEGGVLRGVFGEAALRCREPEAASAAAVGGGRSGAGEALSLPVFRIFCRFGCSHLRSSGMSLFGDRALWVLWLFVEKFAFRHEVLGVPGLRFLS